MSKRYYLGVDDIEAEYDSYSSPSVCSPLRGIFVTLNESRYYFPCNTYEVFVPEECRKQAQEEVWEFVKIFRNIMTADERRECFGPGVLTDILNLGYEKAKEMYDAWVKKNTVKEMTVEEISQALGYKVKIVSKEDK